jgi:hypothetical protein
MLGKFSNFSGPFSSFKNNNSIASTGSSYRFGNNNTDLKYITIPASDDWAFGIDDFTVEWFQYQTQTSPPFFSRIFEVGAWPAQSFAVSIESGIFLLWLNNSLTYYANIILTNYLNKWVHFSVSRQSGTVSIWQNGVRIFTSTIINSITNNTSELWIGSGSNNVWNGYLSNFRIVIGESVYDVSNSNITVPTSPLTSVSGTKLLILFDESLIDLSPYNRDITNYGAILSNLNPF